MLFRCSVIVHYSSQNLNSQIFFHEDSLHTHMRKLFKPTVMQPISHTTYDLNNKQLVLFSNHDPNNKPFDERTILDHLNTELVCYSNPHCMKKKYLSQKSVKSTFGLLVLDGRQVFQVMGVWGRGPS